MNKQHRTIRPMIKAAPASDPITIPAIAPPESPLDPLELEDGVLVALEVEVGSEIVEVIEGSTTPAHRESASEL